MAGEVDDITLINRALARVGAGAIQSLAEDTTLAAKVDAIWSDVKETCLSLHEWTFGTKTFALLRRADPPANGWQYGFDLPGGVLGGPKMVLKSVSRPHDVERHYTLEENILFANRKDLWATFRVVPAIALWPPEFRIAVVIGAAAHLAVPVAHDESLAADLNTQAFGRPEEAMRGGLIGAAIALDRSKAPTSSPLLRGDPLTDARHA